MCFCLLCPVLEGARISSHKDLQTFFFLQPLQIFFFLWENYKHHALLVWYLFSRSGVLCTTIKMGFKCQFWNDFIFGNLDFEKRLWKKKCINFGIVYLKAVQMFVFISSCGSLKSWYTNWLVKLTWKYQRAYNNVVVCILVSWDFLMTAHM